MPDGTFFVATVTITEAINGSAAWITGKNQPYQEVDFIDIPDETTDSIFELYKITYNDLGFIFTAKEQMDEYNRWIIIREDKSEKIAAFILFKTTAWGLKLGIVGTNQSSNGVRAMLTLLTKAFNVEGIYGEVSPPLEAKLQGKVPQIPCDVTSKILTYRITPDTDGFHYTRSINKIGSVRKILIGKIDYFSLIRLLP